ncbi:MAG TPA: valine--tRNA ligase [Candidatus Saccharibacteria bacterium]|nr:valine--tRNA ligase [Candidatus Saccharibacteria bacterium]
MKLPKTYEPKEYERDIYALWEKSEAFVPKGSGEQFTIVLPPPNANAPLHIGHALDFSLKDIIARYQRAKGKQVLMLPGADHAGFETQVVFEKHLAKEGKSRFDFNREELYAQIWDFVQENKGTFETQLRSFGTSCDWTRFTFTLDEKVVKTAYSVFKRLWDDGLIYRGERLVNYCTYHRTGFADIEVKYEDRVTPLYYLKYGPFTLATTRPETKFGDTAVAVHPDDERYKEYVGKVITVDGVNGPFEIRVLADEMVDRNFGTGVVKITPAHDLNDWEVAQRHNLEAIRVINHDGTMNHRAGRFEGMTVLDARKAVVEALKEKDLLEKVDEKYQNRVGVCYKCGTVIEPMLLDQWFVDMKKLAQPAISALREKKITFYPEAKRAQTIDYLKNVRDWNISRQIAWGIPIPAFQNVDDPDEWIFNEQVDQEIIEQDGKTYRRDPDVFDTWFSSGQWPYATLGYPDSDDFKHGYPNSFMEMGVDILYQWGARMICLGLYVTGDVPFKDLYLHGMVRSEDGRKMSKSLGNVIDPNTVLAEYGSDALRMGIIAGRSPGDSAAYSQAKIIAGRNFANKLWNIARFVEGLLEEKKPNARHAKPITPADHWVLSKLQQASEAISLHLDNYRISEAYETMYHFIWDDVADWYVEASKRELNPDVLLFVLESALKLAHPFAPFVSETIWQTLEITGESLLASEQWPEQTHYDKKRVEEFEEIQKIVIETRTIVSAMQLEKTSLYHTDVAFLQEHAELISQLARIEGVHQVEDGKGLRLTTTQHNCWLDIDRERAEKYVKKLVKHRDETKNRLESLKKRLENKDYVKQAPKELVEQTKAQLEEASLLVENIEREMVRFSAPLETD